jgi:hypothetical protein
MRALTDLAWVAGYVDGEGCVGVYTTGANRSLRLTVQVNSVDFRSIEKLHDLFGGYINQSCNTMSGRTLHQWRLTNKSAEDMLMEIMPYLLVKREQAEVALVFRATQDPAIRQECNMKLRELKKAVN